MGHSRRDRARRLLARAGVAGAVVALTLGLPRASQQPPVFRGATETVPVFATVTDKDGRLVTTLAREDFEVFDNGKPQAIALFDNTPQPIRLIVLLDVSGSMYGNLRILREASRQLYARLRADDQVRVGTFGSEIAIGPAFTSDPTSLDAALPTAIPPDAPTPLWAAVNAALDGFPQGGGRRVVLVLSDGKDTGPVKFGQPFITLPFVMDRAQRDGVMVYSVGMRSRAASSQRRPVFDPASLAADWPDPGLATIALETGGGYFEIKPSDDLAAAFARVVDELHGQYLLGFAPPSRDGRRHKVEVKLHRPGLKVRARKNYVALASASTSVVPFRSTPCPIAPVPTALRTSNSSARRASPACFASPTRRCTPSTRCSRCTPTGATPRRPPRSPSTSSTSSSGS